MQLDGLKPTPGTHPADRLAGKPKAEPKPGAKSFGDAFAKAKAAGQPAPSVPAVPVQSPEPPAPSADSHIDTIRFRLQTGYYNNPKVDDALSDKLSGYFDDVA